MIILNTASSTFDFLISKNLQPKMTNSWYKLMQHPAGSASAQLCCYCCATTTVLKNWRNKRVVMSQNNVMERSTRKTHTLHEQEAHAAHQGVTQSAQAEQARNFNSRQPTAFRELKQGRSKPMSNNSYCGTLKEKMRENATSTLKPLWLQGIHTKSTNPRVISLRI